MNNQTEVNTKTQRNTPTRNWFATWNNPPADGHAALKELFEQAKATYVVGQMEKGKDGTPHL